MNTEAWLGVIGVLNLVWLTAAWFAKRIFMGGANVAINNALLIERKRWGKLMEHHNEQHASSDDSWEGFLDDAAVITKEGWPEGWDN